MSEFRASNGVHVFRSGGYFGFGKTASEAINNSQDGNPRNHFFWPGERQALKEFFAAGGDGR